MNKKMLKVEIIGNIGNDAEIKEFGGKKYVSFSVAHTEYQKDEQGNRTDFTTWCSVLWFGDGGGLLQYLKRGAKVFVRGNLKVKLYNDKNGVAQCGLNVSATEVQLCGSRSDSVTQQYIGADELEIDRIQEEVEEFMWQYNPAGYKAEIVEITE